MEVRICDRFQAMSPISIRRERASEIFRLVRRLNEYTARENKKKKNGGETIRIHADDTWF